MSRAAPFSTQGPPVIMGILNVTPDSFSDGGCFTDIGRAVAHAEQMVADGADMIDVGGESTRPGAQRISLEEERARVLPVVQALHERAIRVSIDTTRAQVASEAVAAGAQVVNDVSGGLADPNMLPLVADLDAGYIAMHWRAPSAVMIDHATYSDVVNDVARELEQRVDAAMAAGIGTDRLCIDPGLGFAKTVDQSWQVLAHLEVLHKLGLPILVGTSRKRMLAQVLGQHGEDLQKRDWATSATTAFAAQQGAWGVRVHDVRTSQVAASVGWRLRVAGCERLPSVQSKGAS